LYSKAGAPSTRAYGEAEGYISSGGGWGDDGREMGTSEGDWGGLAARNLQGMSQNLSELISPGISRAGHGYHMMFLY
jgi:hypothetical protein